MSKRTLCMAVCAVAAMVVGGMPAWAHVFPTRSKPEVGSVIDHAPKSVRIWFGGALEKVFSHIRVKDAKGRKISKGNGEVKGKHDTLLEADLPPLSPGKYHVYWSVVALDGHRTMGDFIFTVKQP